MSECLERVIASDYKKMEIVVYDDSSGDDTSILIRSFAHAGVRFVPGVALEEGWLGRNHALEVLADEASGTYIVFMDVDTKIGPTTISQLVSYMVTENVAMTSVIPGRDDTNRASTLFSHLRYFWGLILARTSTPAASSSLWMIKRDTLVHTLGGFTPHRNEVLVEEHIAAILGPSQYRCLVNTPALGVMYEKRWESQIETSRRLLFPTMGGMWYGALAGIVSLLFLSSPLALVILGFFVGWGIVQAIGFFYMALGIIIYAVYLHRVWTRLWWLGALLWPYVILQELCLFLASVWGYMRGTIMWKGRSVTASPIRVDHLEIDE
jgi:cellulose synthase/poly-beta-1,6-N-acetylglucosamine synthase-like glycosyltransferase